MPPWDAFHLARAQFAFTVSAHIEAMWLWTKRPVYLDLFRYWLKPFSLAFGMGVVSGLVMSYQFGTNWGAFADKAGPVIGPLMGYEVLSAFFLEAGFLGVMLFGMSKVGPRLHFMATCIVAIGTLISAFWILSVNSWMQTPAGFSVAADGRFMPTSWMAIIFNPSFFVRFPHMVLASYLSVAFVVGATGAWHLLRRQAGEASRTMFSMALWMAAIVAPLQIVMGDIHGLNTLEHQPAKVAAMEGLFETTQGAPMAVFGIPNMQTGRLDYAVEIPHAASLILRHDWNGEVRGLNSWLAADRPNALIVFWSFRLMVGLGFAMLGLGAWSLWLRHKRRVYDSRLLQLASVLMAPSGLVALLAGWVTTEVGRQPYTVYGALRTAQSLSPVGAPGVAISLAAFVLVYLTVFTAGVLLMLRIMARPPMAGEPVPARVPSHAAGLTPGPAMAAE